MMGNYIENILWRQREPTIQTSKPKPMELSPPLSIPSPVPSPVKKSIMMPLPQVPIVPVIQPGTHPISEWTNSPIDIEYIPPMSSSIKPNGKSLKSIPNYIAPNNANISPYEKDPLLLNPETPQKGFTSALEQFDPTFMENSFRAEHGIPPSRNAKIDPNLIQLKRLYDHHERESTSSYYIPYRKPEENDHHDEIDERLQSAYDESTGLPIIPNAPSAILKVDKSPKLNVYENKNI